MPSLRDDQARFAAGLLAGDDAATAELIAGDGLDPRARLAVYRHHVLTTLTAALEGAFPVVCRLVDRRFFAYAADAFIRRNPPTGPCLAEYGAAFPDFLADFDACASLRFLPDVARLEWAVHVAAQAVSAGEVDLAGLRSVDPQDVPRLRLVPRPGLTYIASPWPVDGIWQAHQDGEAAALPDLGAGEVCLEIGPSENGVRLCALGRAAHALRSDLARGLTLGEAAERAFALDPGFDLSAELALVLGGGLFTDYTLTTTEGERSCRRTPPCRPGP
jgi:hypothetical protein